LVLEEPRAVTVCTETWLSFLVRRYRRVDSANREMEGATVYRSILVVEDEATLRRVIARNLTCRGHVVLEADTSAAAVALAIREKPDLMLLDINLPDRTGWDVLRELRRNGVQIPTVVVSAVRVSASRLEEFDLLAYLPKPFPLEALLRLVGGEAEPANVSPEAIPG
jgi:CheY-like chemotaxis protein